MALEMVMFDELAGAVGFTSRNLDIDGEAGEPGLRTSRARSSASSTSNCRVRPEGMVRRVQGIEALSVYSATKAAGICETCKPTDQAIHLSGMLTARKV